MKKSETMCLCPTLSEIYNPNTFMYFAYGSNIFPYWIQYNNPSAEFISIARLDNYRLDFIKYSSFWGGPTATAVPTANAHIWGVLWRLHKDDMITLNLQNEMKDNKYCVKYLTVLTPHMGTFRARAYIQRVNPLPRGDKDPIPVENWPSWSYKEIMVMGAEENHFPPYYIKYLKNLIDNGDEGGLRTLWILMQYATNECCECEVSGRIPRKPLKLNLRPIESASKISTKNKKVMNK